MGRIIPYIMEKMFETTNQKIKFDTILLQQKMMCFHWLNNMYTRHVAFLSFLGCVFVGLATPLVGELGKNKIERSLTRYVRIATITTECNGNVFLILRGSVIEKVDRSKTWPTGLIIGKPSEFFRNTKSDKISIDLHFAGYHRKTSLTIQVELPMCTS